jgi:biotin-(acetyl-CoA carboxylase) ligase
VTALLRQIQRVVGLLHAGEADAVLQAWRAMGAAGLAGALVRWGQADDTFRGRTRGVDQDGALLVEVDGRLERIVAGEVVWETGR